MNCQLGFLAFVSVMHAKNLLFIAGYGTYLEDLFSKDIDPAFAKMAAEYGATFQKTNTVRNVVARNRGICMHD